ncbi:MAG: hypothetical protein PHU51_02620 [Candidatus Nanoarchaeia archaeon]|nr:hypothetical protein [Candidatus Nanoarchaeia archaeon]
MDSFFKKYENIIVGIILFTIIILTIYVPSFVKTNHILDLDVPLCKYAGNSDYKFIELEKEYVGIPDYNVETYITPDKSVFNLGEIVKFSIRNEDLSLSEIKNPYYYIFIYDSEDKLRYMFPCFCQEEESKVDLFYDCHYNSGLNLCNLDEESAKIKSWIKNHKFIENNREVHCSNTKTNFCVANECRDMNDLFMGQTQFNREFIYSFPVDMLGIWKIEVLTFGEEYLLRDLGKNTNLNADAYYNALSHSSAKIDVGNQYNTINNLKKIWDILVWIITIGAVVGVFIKFYFPLKKLVKKYQTNILIFVISGVIIILTSIIINLWLT